MRFGFDVLDFNDSTLCLKTKRIWYPHGGTAWSSAYRLWNIDVRTGGNSNPRGGARGDIVLVDKFISDFFGDNGIGQFTSTIRARLLTI